VSGGGDPSDGLRGGLSRARAPSRSPPRPRRERRYDPRALTAAARAHARPARVSLAPIFKGEGLVLAGLSSTHQLMHRKSTCVNAKAVVSISGADAPRFRAVHEEVVKLDHDFGATFSGVLCDAGPGREGQVRALYASFAEQKGDETSEWCAGMPASVWWPWVCRVAMAQEAQARGRAAHELTDVFTLDAEMESLLLSKAAKFGLPAEWVDRLCQVDPDRRQCLRVKMCVAGSHAREVLREGDLVLAAGGSPIVSVRALEEAVR